MATIQPGTSRIEDYQRLLNPQLNQDMNKQQEINQYCCRYKMMGMAPKIVELVKEVENEQLSYLNFLVHLFDGSIAPRKAGQKNYS
jgi:hypothetical protein